MFGVGQCLCEGALLQGLAYVLQVFEHGDQLFRFLLENVYLELLLINKLVKEFQPVARNKLTKQVPGSLLGSRHQLGKLFELIFLE
jgi:hypothetical protein